MKALRLMAAACVAGGSLVASATTYYADFKGTSNSYAKDWYNVDNWWVKDENDQNVRPTTVPQEGDDVIVNSGCGQISANTPAIASRTAYLNSMTFNASPASSIHQGHIGFLANHPGLKVANNVNVGTWAGLAVKGSGDFVVDIGSGGGYNNQKGVEWCTNTDKITLIKKGAGSFNPVHEGNSTYRPVRTILMGGTFLLRNAAVAAGHELVFGSNESNIRLKMEHLYSAGRYDSYREFNLSNGALIESNEVNNTEHGFTSDDNARGFYVRITGTPKLAEQRFTGSLYNTAGIAFCPGAKQAGGADYLFTIAKVANPDRAQGHGRLAVTNGTLRLTEGATFKKLQKLNVGPTGTFKIESGSGADAFTLELDVAAGGKLDLASGVTLNSQATKIGGEMLAAGTYTAANCTAITGEGTLVVTPYSTLDPIVLDVPQNAYIEAALTAYNTAHGESVSIATLNGGVDKERPLVKRGAGELGMNKPMSNYVAPVYVEEGSLLTYVRYSIGKEGNDIAPVYVRSGATFKTFTTNEYMNANRIFHIAGNGTASYGAALYCGANEVAGNYGNKSCFGKTVILDGDATGNVGNWMYMGSSRLELNGHTLTFKLSAGESTDRPAHLPPTIAGPGEIVVKGGQWRNPGTITFEGAGKVTFDEAGGFRMTGGEAQFAGTHNNWTFEFNGPTRNIFYCDYNISPRDSKGNSLFKSLVVNSKLALWNQGDRNRNYLLVKAPISGTGGFSTGDTRTSFLHLLNPNQTYTGGITFNQGVIWAYPDGAIPFGDGAGDVKLQPSTTPLKTTTSAPFTNTFNGVAFMCPDTYHLPNVQSTGSQPARIQNGQGAWKTVTQNGTGGLEYYSSLNADKLDVKKGTVKLGRGMMAGLWEGTNLYASAADATTAYNGTVSFTNLAVRGPTSAIKDPGHNYTYWQPKELITYTGYIWNRGSETVTWSLASALTGSVTVKVDGETVISGANEILHNNVTLTPGPHTFEYRACSGDTAADRITNLVWRTYHGFAIDRQGRNTGNSADYEMGVDTGDGALFTRTVEAALPQFGEMALAASTTFDVNGNAFVADKVRVAGASSVASTAGDASAAPSFTVNGRFEVDGSGAIGAFTSAVPLTFGPDCVFAATNLATTAHNTYTIAQTSGDAAFTVQGSLTRGRFTTDSKKWSVQVAPDGKSIQLVYMPGFMVIVK